MRDFLLAYLETPSREPFLALRVAQISHRGFNPYSGALDCVPEMLNARMYRDVVDRITKHMTPDYLLSPGAHMELGFAHEKLGQEQESRMERFIGFQLVNGIKLTGDGTESSPFLVTRTSDEYDLLNYLAQTPTGQALCRRDNRHFDRITTKEGGTFWFDITEIYGLMQRQFESPQT